MKNLNKKFEKKFKKLKKLRGNRKKLKIKVEIYQGGNTGSFKKGITFGKL